MSFLELELLENVKDKYYLFILVNGRHPKMILWETALEWLLASKFLGLKSKCVWLQLLCYESKER